MFSIPRSVGREHCHETIDEDPDRPETDRVADGPSASGIIRAEEIGDNLICDGGMEEWQATGPQGGWWNYLTVSCKATEFGRDEKKNILTPKIFSQAYETKVLKPECNDVHGGRKALRLKGQFYLSNSSSDAFKTKEGDVYVVRYWAKGEGQTAMYLHVYGDAVAQILETKGRLSKGQWSLIEERIQVVGTAPTTIYPRLYASEEILVDDVFVGRVIREGERKLEEVPADCQQRVAFAWDCGGKMTIDGKTGRAGLGPGGEVRRPPRASRSGAAGRRIRPISGCFSMPIISISALKSRCAIVPRYCASCKGSR